MKKLIIGYSLAIAASLSGPAFSQPAATAGGDFTPPVGTIVAFAGAYPAGQPVDGANLPGNAPMAGWLWCNGGQITKDKYPLLWDTVGTTYGGSGDVHQLPNLMGRFPLGHATNRPLGEAKGKSEHTILAKELPPHKHNGTTGKGTSMKYRLVESAGKDTGRNHIVGHKAGAVYHDREDDNYEAGQHRHRLMTESTLDMDEKTNLNSNPEKDNNMPPYLVINYIIKADGPAKTP